MLTAVLAALALNPFQGTPPATSVPPLQYPEKIDAKHQKDIDHDKALGKEYTKEVAKEFKISTNPEYQAKVDQIGQQLAAIANQTHAKALWGDTRFSPFDYHFTVLQDKDVNAFSLPGGYIYVDEGLMRYVESDDELAGVLAHEIAHAAFRHVATLQRESQKLALAQLPLILIGIFAGGAAGAVEGLQVGSLLTQAVGSGWSVRAEQAADYGGFQFLLKSHYNPTGMLTMMERLARDEKSSPAGLYDLGIYRTHPPGPERAQSLTKYMKEAGVQIRRSEVTTTFRTVALPAPNGAFDVDFGPHKLATLRGPDASARAVEAARRLNVFFDQVPQLYEVRAGSDGTVMGLGQPLLTLEPSDVTDPHANPAQLADTTVKAIKDSLYNIAYRVWGIREME